MRVGRRATDPKPASGVPAHLDRAGQVWEICFAGKQVHLEARINFKFAEFVLGREQAVGTAALRGRRQRPDVRVIDCRCHLFAPGQVPDALITVGAHEVEVAHRRQEVEIAVAAIASASVVKRVHRPEAAEELFVFLQHRRADLLIDHRRLDAEHRLEHRVGEQPVAVVVEVAAVERQVVFWRCHHLFGGGEQIDEADLLLRRDVPHGLGVKPQVRVVDGGMDAFDIFVGDRREQHESRAVFAVERLGLGRRDVAVEVVPKLGQAVWPGE